jgi:hypothetical protein
MTRLGLLLCVLCFFSGCASDAEKGSWDEVWKDLRGDNMQMKGFSGTSAFPRPPRADDTP